MSTREITQLEQDMATCLMDDLDLFLVNFFEVWEGKVAMEVLAMTCVLVLQEKEFHGIEFLTRLSGKHGLRLLEELEKGYVETINTLKIKNAHVPNQTKH